MQQDLFSLHGKVIMVSGGAGHLGSALTEGFVQYGARVYIVSPNTEKNAHYADKLSKNFGVPVFYETMDVTNADSVTKTTSLILQKEQKVDVLVNNAYQGNPGDVLNASEEDWITSFDGSIHSTYRLTKAVLPAMIRQQTGSIINIASMYGVVSPNPEIYGGSGQNNPPHYGAAKAAIIQFTKYIAAHYGKDGIRANAISPGPFPTEAVQENKSFIQELNRKNPLGRIGSPNELKGTAVLLASEASSYITGQNICVDGGWTVW